MADIKEKLAMMLNKGLELEHAARIQYLTHAQMIKGLGAEKLIERLEEISSDEQKHEEKFRNLVGTYLGQETSMSLAVTHKAAETKDILKINLKGEKDAIDYYKQIYKTITENKEKLQYEFETLKHEIRHIIIDEQEHVTELLLLLG